MIYVAGPYYHADAAVIERRMELVYTLLAQLTARGNNVVTPMLMHAVVLRYDLPNNYEYWGKLSEDLLSRCDEMVVLKTEGWDKSMGLMAEIKLCEAKGIPYRFVTEEEVNADCSVHRRVAAVSN